MDACKMFWLGIYVCRCIIRSENTIFLLHRNMVFAAHADTKNAALSVRWRSRFLFFCVLGSHLLICCPWRVHKLARFLYYTAGAWYLLLINAGTKSAALSVLRWVADHIFYLLLFCPGITPLLIIMSCPHGEEFTHLLCFVRRSHNIHTYIHTYILFWSGGHIYLVLFIIIWINNVVCGTEDPCVVLPVVIIVVFPVVTPSLACSFVFCLGERWYNI